MVSRTLLVESRNFELDRGGIWSLNFWWHNSSSIDDWQYHYSEDSQSTSQRRGPIWWKDKKCVSNQSIDRSTKETHSVISGATFSQPSASQTNAASFLCFCSTTVNPVESLASILLEAATSARPSTWCESTPGKILLGSISFPSSSLRRIWRNNQTPRGFLAGVIFKPYLLTVLFFGCKTNSRTSPPVPSLITWKGGIYWLHARNSKRWLDSDPR